MPRICTVESSCADAVRISVNHPSDVRRRKRFTLSRRGPATAGRRRNDLTIFIDLTLGFWQFSDMKRLLAEIVIIVAVIFFGWNKPYKDWTDQAYAKITSTLDQMGGNLQKNQDQSVKRY